MKKIVGLFLMIGLCSCTSVRLPSPRHFVGLIDYTELASKGLFVTESNSVSFPYQPIGSILVEETGGWGDEKSIEVDSNGDDLYGTKKVQGSYCPPDIRTAMNRMGTELKRVGANGIINLKISTSMDNYPGLGLRIEKITISGMAIKK